MLWNSYTIDACFLSPTWHITFKGMFAGSVLGVFFLCIAIEGARRIGREYDRRLVFAARLSASAESAACTSDHKASSAAGSSSSITWMQQVIRGVLYGSQFTAAFLVMLLGMYYNGYILFAIFLGQTTGYIVFGRDTITANEDVASGSCC